MTPDTTGTAAMQWAYDTWTAPWVQVSGDPLLLSPGSYATFVVLTCASAHLERERAARHLSAQECEHRMAAIRSEQDTSLVFRLHFRVFDFPASEALARLYPDVHLTLEDDRGRSWVPIEVNYGGVLPSISGQELKRLSYEPPWLRSVKEGKSDRYAVMNGKGILIGEHRARFARRDEVTGASVVDSRTRWLSLHVTYGSNEWVSTWRFRLAPDDTTGGLDGTVQSLRQHGGER